MADAAPAPVTRLTLLWAHPRRDRGILVGILLLALGLRLHRLGSVPPGAYTDEIALGTNGYCLAKTLRSLKGDLLPLYVHEQSFEKYGPSRIIYQPIYQYTVAGIVGALGKSVFTLRLASTFYGLLGIVAAFGLARKLFDTRVALTAAAFLAVSPWHHQYSRIAFEVISMIPLITFGIWMLLEGLNDSRKLALGAFLLALSTYAYPVARMFVPLLVAGFGAVYFRELRASPRPVLRAIAVAVVVGLPNLYLVLFDPSQGRMHSVLITSAGLDNELAVQVLKSRSAPGSLAAAVLAHRGLLVPFVFAYNYLSYLSPVFLFFSGDTNPRHALQGLGMCPLYTAPLLMLGVIRLLVGWKEKSNRFLLWWFLIWPIPASLTTQSPHATRAIVALPLLEILSAGALVSAAAAGWPFLLSRVGIGWKSALSTALLGFLVLRGPLETISFFQKYHGDYAVTSGPAWNSGAEEAFALVRKELREGDKVFVSKSVENAWLNVLFFVDWDPSAPLDPDRPRWEQLPAPYHVADSGRAPWIFGSSLWIVREDEAGRHSLARTVARIPFPDQRPNLVVLRYEGEH